MIECRNIAKGKAKGELIVSTEPISFLGGVNPENGEINERCCKKRTAFNAGWLLDAVIVA